MMKLRIATGLGLLLIMATMIGSSVRVSQAQDEEGVTLADLAGNFAGRGGGFYTACFNGAALISCSSVSPVPTLVPANDSAILHTTRDAAGNSCEVITETGGRLSGAKFFNFQTRTVVSTTTSFDPATGSGTASFSDYHGGSCVGATFDSTGAILTDTGTRSFMVSDSGNRIDAIVTSLSMVTSPFGVAGSMKETMPAIKATSIRESD